VCLGNQSIEYLVGPCYSAPVTENLVTQDFMLSHICSFSNAYIFSFSKLFRNAKAGQRHKEELEVIDG
jgi:elongation factor P--beta-lysine ligase